MSFPLQLCDSSDAFTICQTNEGAFAEHSCNEFVNKTDVSLGLYPGWNNISVLIHDSNHTSSSRSIYVEPVLARTSNRKPVLNPMRNGRFFDEIHVISLPSNLVRGYQRVVEEELATSELLSSVDTHLFEGVVVDPGLSSLETLVEQQVITREVRDNILQQEETGLRVVAINLTRGNYLQVILNSSNSSSLLQAP